MNFDLKLRILRSGRSQVEIARAASLSPSRLSNLVRGHDPRPDEAAAVAKVLGVEPDKLFPSPLRAVKRATPGAGTSPTMTATEAAAVLKSFADLATSPEASEQDRLELAVAATKLQRRFNLSHTR